MEKEKIEDQRLCKKISDSKAQRERHDTFRTHILWLMQHQRLVTLYYPEYFNHALAANQAYPNHEISQTDRTETSIGTSHMHETESDTASSSLHARLSIVTGMPVNDTEQSQLSNGEYSGQFSGDTVDCIEYLEVGENPWT